MGSSQLVEYLVALVVGILAVLGALLCIGFLLVEPIRSPPTEVQPTVSLGKQFALQLVMKMRCVVSPPQLTC